MCETLGVRFTFVHVLSEMGTSLPEMEDARHNEGTYAARRANYEKNNASRKKHVYRLDLFPILLNCTDTLTIS